MATGRVLGVFYRCRNLCAPPFIFSVGLVLVGLASAGCKSASQYVSPRVEGRVLDAESHQPIKNVLVRRVNLSAQVASENLPPRGGQLIEQGPVVSTGSDGSFVLDSEKDVALLHNAPWYSVTISFGHKAYQVLTTTYTVNDSTNTPSGEPLISTGNIYLIPLAK